MRKLVVISHSDDYDVGGLVRYLIKMFERKEIIGMFEKNGFQIMTSNYIKEVLKLSEIDFLNNIDEEFNEDYLIFGIHPYGLDVSIKSNSKIKKIVWINDPHYFAHFVDRKGEIVQRYSKKYDPIHLNRIDYLVTPSSIYFKNLKIDNYNEKIIDFFYFLDEDLYEQTGNAIFEERIGKVVLSGVVGGGYKSRIEFENLSKDPIFEEIIFQIKHPGFGNILNKSIPQESHMIGLKYYNELTKYKAAFVGHHIFPIDFCLAKHIEVLMCGCLGFFEPNPLLKEQLGLIEYVHYIPCFENGELIKDPNFYLKWMNSDEGAKISENGKSYVRNKFGKNYIEDFIKFLKNIK